jgi:hypothetical protein
MSRIAVFINLSLNSMLQDTSNVSHPDRLTYRLAPALNVRVMVDQISTEHAYILTTIHWNPTHILVSNFDDSIRKAVPKF